MLRLMAASLRLLPATLALTLVVGVSAVSIGARHSSPKHDPAGITKVSAPAAINVHGTLPASTAESVASATTTYRPFRCHSGSGYHPYCLRGLAHGIPLYRHVLQGSRFSLLHYNYSGAKRALSCKADGKAWGSWHTVRNGDGVLNPVNIAGASKRWPHVNCRARQRGPDASLGVIPTRPHAWKIPHVGHPWFKSTTPSPCRSGPGSVMLFMSSRVGSPMRLRDHSGMVRPGHLATVQHKMTDGHMHDAQVHWSCDAGSYHLVGKMPVMKLR